MVVLRPPTCPARGEQYNSPVFRRRFCLPSPAILALHPARIGIGLWVVIVDALARQLWPSAILAHVSRSVARFASHVSGAHQNNLGAFLLATLIAFSRLALLTT